MVAGRGALFAAGEKYIYITVEYLSGSFQSRRGFVLIVGSCNNGICGSRVQMSRTALFVRHNV